MRAKANYVSEQLHLFQSFENLSLNLANHCVDSLAKRVVNRKELFVGWMISNDQTRGGGDGYTKKANDQKVVFSSA
ncbi:hypothetical protein QQP08_018502 [Theobroma cacao]|nr:hypothetical protein QQP08_018502 [Theobroma cacao]